MDKLDAAAIDRLRVAAQVASHDREAPLKLRVEPATILALLDRLEQAEDRVAALKELLQKSRAANGELRLRTLEAQALTREALIHLDNALEGVRKEACVFYDEHEHLLDTQ